MRPFFVAALLLLISGAARAQGDTTQKGNPQPTKASSSNNQPRSNDHFLMQFGYTGWTGAPDSIKTKGFPRTFNAYLMIDFPFKTNPHWSAAIGAGVATDAIYLDESSVAITGTTPDLVFKNLSDTNHFKKYKLATAYAEAPVELRYSSNPDDNKNSVKAALGIKVGMLLDVHTKGKTMQNKADQVVYDYKEKLFNKGYFNKTRIAATARLGYGHFSLFATYSLTPLFKEGVAATIRPYTIGLTLSGL